MHRLPLVAALVAVLIAAACGPDEPAAGPTPTAPTTEPEPTEPEPTEPTEPEPTEPEPTEPEPTEPEGTEEVTVHLVRSHESGLWVEPVRVTLAEPTVAVARAAMEALVSGDPVEGADPALETLAPPGTRVLDVAVSDDRVLTVDLSDDVRDGSAAGGATEEAFAQQLAHTGTQFGTVDAVAVRVEGEPITELWGHVDWSEPLEPDPFAVSPITFTSHGWGEQVPAGEVTVGGEACTFEATVELRLHAPDGSIAEETFTTAAVACPEGGPWEHTFDLTGPGAWTVEAVEPDPSGGEGRPPFVTTLELEAT